MANFNNPANFTDPDGRFSLGLAGMAIETVVKLGFSLSGFDAGAALKAAADGEKFGGIEGWAEISGSVAFCATIGLAIHAKIQGWKAMWEASVTKVVDKMMGRGGSSNLEDEKLPQRENIYDAPVRAAGSVVNPNTNRSLEYDEMEFSKAEKAFSRDKSDPTYGYYKSGNEWQRIVFDPNYKMQNYQGAYLRIRPYQTQIGEVTIFPIALAYIQFSKLTPSILQDLLLHVNTLYANIPLLTPPQQDANNRPVLKIIVGEFGASEAEKAQSRSDASQILEYFVQFFPSSEINVVISTDSRINQSGAQFYVGPGTVGFEFTVKMNNYGD